MTAGRAVGILLTITDIMMMRSPTMCPHHLPELEEEEDIHLSLHMHLIDHGEVMIVWSLKERFLMMGGDNDIVMKIIIMTVVMIVIIIVEVMERLEIEGMIEVGEAMKVVQ